MTSEPPPLATVMPIVPQDLKTDILYAARIGDVEGIKRTLKKAEEFNIYTQILNSQNERGYSALHVAIRN